MKVDQLFKGRVRQRLRNALHRARRPLERRLAAIRKMPSLHRPGKRRDRLMREVKSIHKKLERMTPWNITTEFYERTLRQELRASKRSA